MTITYPASCVLASIVSNAVSGTTWSAYRVLLEVLAFLDRVLVFLVWFCTLRWTYKFLLRRQWILCSWNNIYCHFRFLYHTRWLSLIGFFSYNPHAHSWWGWGGGGCVLCWLNLQSRISRVFFLSSIWQTISGIFMHKKSSQCCKILPHGIRNPHLQKGVGLLVLLFFVLNV